jgi:endonuclease/exonuclease/phosphatase family metal-dependent hydrolase
MQRQKPDLCLFQEVDLNAKRTGRRRIADMLAAKFDFNYVFGVEFEELSQGSETNPAFQGQAIFARSPISHPRILRFARQAHFWEPRWYLPRWQVFQRRKGGRMALTAEVELGASRLVVYDVHLESKGGDGLRFAQLSEVVLDSLRYPPSVPVVVTGDLNSSDPPSMWSTYMLHFGFQDACAGTARRGTKRDGRTLDWIFTRGPVYCSESRVHSDIAASDHFPVSTVLTLKV